MIRRRRVEVDPNQLAFDFDGLWSGQGVGDGQARSTNRGSGVESVAVAADEPQGARGIDGRAAIGVGSDPQRDGGSNAPSSGGLARSDRDGVDVFGSGRGGDDRGSEPDDRAGVPQGGIRVLGDVGATVRSEVGLRDEQLGDAVSRGASGGAVGGGVDGMGRTRSVGSSSDSSGVLRTQQADLGDSGLLNRSSIYSVHDEEDLSVGDGSGRWLATGTDGSNRGGSRQTNGARDPRGTFGSESSPEGVGGVVQRSENSDGDVQGEHGELLLGDVFNREQRSIMDAAMGARESNALEGVDDEGLDVSFRLDAGEQRPHGVTARVRANMEALRVMARANAGGVLGADDYVALSRWSAWGGLSAVFDEREGKSERFAEERAELHELLGDKEYAAARRSVINAHYTHDAYVMGMWRALSEAGVAGRGLEPGCGSGTFIGRAPGDVEMVGVELDPTAAQIGQLLHGRHEVVNEGFEATSGRGAFDFAVSNVPFGDIALYDPVHNAGNHSIHNHFIIKALGMTKPGGYVAVVTSSFTMDGQNPGARRDMYERADLVSAIRLPSGAHQEVANTEVVTDVLIFRVREDGQEAQPFDWEYANLVDLDGHQVRVNDRFVADRGRVLGEMSVSTGMYGAQTLRVLGAEGEVLGEQIYQRLSTDLSHGREQGLGFAPVDEQVVSVPDDLDAPIGSIRLVDDAVRVRTSSQWEDVKVAKTHMAEVRALVDLLDKSTRLVEMEAQTKGESEVLEQYRAELRDSYEEYVATYGAINRNTKSVSVRRVKNADGVVEEQEKLRIVYPKAHQIIARDPRSSVLFSVEKYDEETGAAKGAPILYQRQIAARYVPKGADNARDAVAMSLEQRGRVDVEYVAYLLGGVSEVEARELMRGLVFDDPERGLVTREVYLSGNVRAKLEIVQRLVDEGHEQYGENVDALEAVLPAEVGAQDIHAELGVSWIPASDYQDFLRYLLDDGRPRVTNEGSSYSVTLAGADRLSYEQVSKWGTERMPAKDILRHLLNFTTIRVVDKDIDGVDMYNPVATEAAQAKAEAMNEEFSRWVWSDAQRAERLIGEYNRRFNCMVARSYEEAGSHLRLPGLARSLRLYDHQKGAVARMIAEPTCGLFHEVGAGKTLEMICGVMEQKRLGLINKPMAVVPKHLLAQFARKWQQAYPNARVLAVDTDQVSKESDRRDFLAKVVTSPWDVIICSQTAFEKIPVGMNVLQSYADKELSMFDAAIAEVASEKDSVAKLEKARARAEERIQMRVSKVADSKDESGLTFESLGVDYLLVDEAHLYKNLGAQSSIDRGGLIVNEPVKRCVDMDLKLTWLRQEYGERVATFATATPVANALGEMWVMMKYLRPDLLQETGTDVFDRWVKTFAVQESNVEISASGKVAVKERFSGYKNVPELLSMWTTFADVKLSDDLDLPVPELMPREDGKRAPEIVTVDLGVAMEQFSVNWGERAERIHNRSVAPWEDNWLNLTNDGRTFGLDYRLLNADRAQRALVGVDTDLIGRQKVDVAAEKIASIYHATKDRMYEGQDAPGAFQIVFCDQGVPGKEWSVYEELKSLLVERGLPADKIAFAHDAKNTVEKDQLFVRCRSGAVAVLIGSTGKMGTGANMQTRAVALHHLDAPWRPADLTQREGRIIRQGNLNPEVAIYRYVTEGSMDAYVWQTLERKAAFISQVMRGKIDGREIEEDTRQQLEYAEVKAIATGNPLLYEQARLRNEVTRLRRRQQGWEQNVSFLKGRLGFVTGKMRLNKLYGQDLERALGQYRSTVGDAFSMRIAGHTYTSRSEAVEALGVHMRNDVLGSVDGEVSWSPAHDLQSWTGTLRFLDVSVGSMRLQCAQMPGKDLAVGFSAQAMPVYRLSGVGYESYEPRNRIVAISTHELANPNLGTLRKLENYINAFPQRLEECREVSQTLKQEHQQLVDALEGESPYVHELERARGELDKVSALIREESHSEGMLSAHELVDSFNADRGVRKISR